MSTYTVEVVNSIEDSVFDRIYDANSSNIDANMGYSDKERLKLQFKFLGKTNFVFQLKNNDTIVAYAKFSLSRNKKEVFITNIVNDSDRSFVGLFEPIHAYLKSNKVEYVVCESIKDSSVYNAITKHLNRPDIAEYDSSKDIINERNNIMSKLKVL